MTTTNAEPARGLTIANVATRLRVSPERIHRWIRTGQLRAFNRRDGGKRPAYVVLPSDLDAFLAARSAAPSAPSKPPTRKRKQTNQIDYYPG